jgi:hypothetical protein
VTNTQYDDGGRSREEAKQKAPDLVSGQIRGSPYGIVKLFDVSIPGLRIGVETA